ncbi:hypothetical protein [Mycobacterium sp.]|nr:hypothetical protein [Mycobacterium sp.]
MGLDTDAVRLLRDESPAITRMLNDPHDTIAADHGAEALATLLTR